MTDKLRFIPCLLATSLIFAAACSGDDGSTATDSSAETDSDTDETEGETNETNDPTTAGPGDGDGDGDDPPVCGDEVVEGDEVCDDGNDDDTDDCTILCMPPACDDGIISGTETDVDCGGAECEAVCADGQGCFAPEDCASLSCDPDNNVCLEATCEDGILNGTEEEIDCGGDTCGPCAEPSFVINEIDYDQPGGDSAEFVEIHNGLLEDMPLEGIWLVMINGSNQQVYGSVPLTMGGETLPAGGYLVVGVQPVLDGLADDVLKIQASNNFLQNGTPDAIALVDVPNQEAIDTVAYEGPVPDIMFMGFTISFTEAEPIDNDDGSLQRIANGIDNDLPSDWLFINPPTPGAENVEP